MQHKEKLSRRRFFEHTAFGGVFAGSIVNLAGKPLGGVETHRQERTRICVFSKHLQWLDYKNMGEAAAEIGFDGVALTVRPGGHVLPERAENDLPKAVEAVRQAGIEVPMLTTAITDPADAQSQTILTLAARYDIRHYRMGYYSYDQADDIAGRLNELKPMVRGLAELNQRFKVFGGYQNHVGEEYVGAPIWDIWELVRDLNPNWIGCQFDVRHATVDGATAWPVHYRLVAPYTRMLAVKDFRWKQINGKWEAENCPLGQGVVDFPRFIQMLKEHAFAGPISLHYEYPLGGAEHGGTKLEMDRGEFFAALKRDLDTLRSWLREGGLLDQERNL